MPETEDLKKAYEVAFTATEDDSIRRARAFAAGLQNSHGGAKAHAVKRWAIAAGAAAAVAAVAITAVALTDSGTTSQVAPATQVVPESSAEPVAISESPATPELSAGMTSTVDANPSSAGLVAQTDAAQTEAIQAKATGGGSPGDGSTGNGSAPGGPTQTGAGQTGTGENSSVGENPATNAGGSEEFVPMAITGPLSAFDDPSTYTQVPAGLVVRSPADAVQMNIEDGTAEQFSIYIAAPNADPKRVIGGYLVVVTLPSTPHISVTNAGEAPVEATGDARQLGNRSWRWNADQTVLISEQSDSNIYIGVLSDEAMMFSNYIPGGYDTADIELIASGIRPSS